MIMGIPVNIGTIAIKYTDLLSISKYHRLFGANFKVQFC